MVDASRSIINISPKTQKEIDRRANIQSSDKYQKMLAQNTKWLQYLDSTDSKKNDGRLDVSVFNAKVAKFGYKATPDEIHHTAPEDACNSMPGRPSCWTTYTDDVDIQRQARNMTDQYFHIDGPIIEE